jgi:hypothetical protein
MCKYVAVDLFGEVFVGSEVLQGSAGMESVMFEVKARGATVRREVPSERDLKVAEGKARIMTPIVHHFPVCRVWLFCSYRVVCSSGVKKHFLLTVLMLCAILPFLAVAHLLKRLCARPKVPSICFFDEGITGPTGISAHGLQNDVRGEQ